MQFIQNPEYREFFENFLFSNTYKFIGSCKEMFMYPDLAASKINISTCSFLKGKIVHLILKRQMPIKIIRLA